MNKRGVEQGQTRLKAPPQLDDILNEKSILARCNVPAAGERKAFEPSSLATMFLYMRSKGLESKKQLSEAQAEHGKSIEALAKREKAVASELRNFYDSLRHFPRFIADNEAKKTTAKATIEREKALLDYLEDQVEYTTRELEVGKMQLGFLDKILAQLADYAEFMSSCRTSAKAFGSIQEIFTRYETLKSSEARLKAMATTTDEGMRRERQRLEDEVCVLSENIFSINEKIAHEINKINNESAARQMQGGLGEAAANELEAVLKELAEIDSAEKNMYENCKHDSLLHNKGATFEERMDFICTYLSDMTFALSKLEGPQRP